MYYHNTPTLAKIHAKAMEFSDSKVQSTLTINKIHDDKE